MQKRSRDLSHKEFPEVDLQPNCLESTVRRPSPPAELKSAHKVSMDEVTCIPHPPTSSDRLPAANVVPLASVTPQTAPSSTAAAVLSYNFESLNHVLNFPSGMNKVCSVLFYIYLFCLWGFSWCAGFFPCVMYRIYIRHLFYPNIHTYTQSMFKAKKNR